MPQSIRVILHKLVRLLTKTVMSFMPSAKHMAFVGDGSSRQLCDHILRTGVKKLLIVTDKPLRDLGVVDAATAALQDSDIEIAYYDGVLPDPTYTQVLEGAAVARASGSEAILAIGGGSSMDAAKVIAVAAVNDGSPADWIGFSKYDNEPIKIYAIPTTSGTGSEATMGAVISDPDTHEKAISGGAGMLPAAVAVDADLLLGLPPHITAATGIDALTHAIEAYISVWDRGSCKDDATMAVKLIFDNLAAACRDGSDRAARHSMAMAAYYAGLAINQVNVGNVHAIAHQIGGKYGIPHGLANALVLPHILEFCKVEAAAPLARLAVLIGLGESAQDEMMLADKFIAAVLELRAEVGIGETSDKIQAADINQLANQALSEGMGYASPRLLDKTTAVAILNKIAA